MKRILLLAGCLIGAVALLTTPAPAQQRKSACGPAAGRGALRTVRAVPRYRVVRVPTRQVVQEVRTVAWAQRPTPNPETRIACNADRGLVMDYIQAKLAHEREYARVYRPGVRKRDVPPHVRKSLKQLSTTASRAYKAWQRYKRQIRQNVTGRRRSVGGYLMHRNTRLTSESDMLAILNYKRSRCGLR